MLGSEKPTYFNVRQAFERVEAKLDQLVKEYSTIYRDRRSSVREFVDMLCGEKVGAVASQTKLAAANREVIDDVDRNWFLTFIPHYESSQEEFWKVQDLMCGEKRKLKQLKDSKDWNSVELEAMPQELEKIEAWVDFALSKSQSIRLNNNSTSPNSPSFNSTSYSSPNQQSASQSPQTSPSQAPQSSWSPEGAAIGIISILGCSLVGYKIAEKQNIKRVKRVLHKHGMLLKNLSSFERQLVFTMNYPWWMPWKRGRLYVHWKIQRIPFQGDISEQLWQVLGELYYGKKPTLKRLALLKKRVEAARIARQLAAAKRRRTKKTAKPR